MKTQKTGRKRERSFRRGFSFRRVQHSAERGRKAAGPKDPWKKSGGGGGTELESIPGRRRRKVLGLREGNRPLLPFFLPAGPLEERRSKEREAR